VNLRRALIVYTWLGLLTLAVALLEWQRAKVPRFDRLEVGRLDVVEPDGKPRVIVSSAAQFPGAIWGGKEYPHPDREKGGILYFNDDGTEAGGTVYANGGAIITFDQHDQDQTLALMLDEDEHGRAAGLYVQDQPAKSLLPLLQAHDDKERERVANELGPAAPRVFAGRQKDGSSGVWLFDAQGKPRLRLQVDAAGEPRLELLDATGKTIARLPS